MTGVKTIELVICYHCGDSCDGSIVFNNKRFCCSGCKTVYSLLNDNGLNSYYQMNSSPGTTVSKTRDNSRFDYLDDIDVITKLLKFREGSLCKTILYVPAIHCSSCIYLLENLYKLKAGVNRSNVNFNLRQVEITFDDTKTSLREVVEFITLLGYEPRITLDDTTNKIPTDHLQKYYVKIAIAFFCFGNMMLLSFPEYLGIDALTESPFRKFFGYLNFALAIPVTFYCAAEFFTSARGALRQRSLNMDIPIVLGIVVMFLRSSYEVFTDTGSGYFDTLGGLVLLMLIGRLFQNKTYDTLSFEHNYKSYFPVAVSVLQGREEKSVIISKLRPGDRILIRNQEVIPADARLLGSSADIDYSFVTGESILVHKTVGDTLYAGGRHNGAGIELEVLKEASQSYLTQLWNDEAFTKKNESSISTLATKVSRWFTPAVIIIACAAGLYWLPLPPRLPEPSDSTAP